MQDLKEQQEGGKVLEKNQLDKLKKGASFEKELEELQKALAKLA